MQALNEQLISIQEGLSYFLPELILSCCILILLSAGLFKLPAKVFTAGCVISLLVSGTFVATYPFDESIMLFGGMLRLDGLSGYLKLLMTAAGIVTCLMSLQKGEHASEYFVLILSVILGGHLLVMSHDFLMVFLSLEFISISSYVLVGYSFNKAGSEGSLKYFLFGSVASALMLYGFSILYGVTGTLNFSDPRFFNQLLSNDSPLVLLSMLLAFAGLLYKIAAAPMHLWAPDVYESAPVPVIAFLSVAPKVAGLGVMTKFLLAVNMFGQSHYDWQLIMGVIAILTITIGNFSALRQTNPKRLMAYSSIAQSGFLLVGLLTFLPQGVHFMLFYATVYMVMNFVVFIYINFFETAGLTTLQSFSGAGRNYVWPSIFLLVGFVSLTGLPPTAGFTAKLLIFSSLWESYEINRKSILLILLVFGLINTVISLFYYLRIPYFAFLKSGQTAKKLSFNTFENVLGIILVLILLGLFLMPNQLMGSINKINFAI